jgi:arylsulfatase A-like enzyme
MRRLGIVACLASFASCGAPAEPPAAGGSGGGRAVDPTTTGPAAAAGEPARVRVRYDLAAGLAHAEVREGDALVIDLGGPGGARHTLGGFRTDVVETEVDGSGVAVTGGSGGSIALPWDREGPAEVAVRVKSLGSGRLRFGVDGEEVASATAPEATVVRFTLPSLARGEHALSVRSPGAGTFAGVGRASAAVDWIRIGPPGSVGEAAPPLPAAVIEGEVPGIRLAAGSTLGFTLRVPEGARLRAVVRGRVEVTAARDGEPDRPLGGADGGPLDLDLASLAGDVARLDVRTGDGGATLLRPAVVTLDAVAPPEWPRPRNVLVYLIDTLRADKLQPYNPETRVRTPGLVDFVRGATTFAFAHGQENWTKPSVATLLTGLLPWEHTATGGESILPESVRMLPEILGDAGYQTGCFIANGYVSDRFGFRQGWGSYRNYIREGRRTQGEHVAADVLRWLDARDAEAPFFLYVHTIDPHVPYRPPAEYLALYGDPRYRGPVDFRRDATLLENIKVGRIRLGEADRAHLEALYDGEISYHDVHFDAILDGLERRGLADDTIVVVTSDHGEEFFDHGSVGHGHSLYEELIHVPLFVRLPGLGARTVDGPVGLVDVMPTVLDALGMQVPDEVSGRSLLPRLLAADEPEPPIAIAGVLEGQRAIVASGMKLVQRGPDRIALYDLAADPDEEHDVSDERPIALRWLRGRLGLALAESGGGSVGAGGARPRSRPRHRPVASEIDPETAAQLRALGYIH